MHKQRYFIHLCFKGTEYSGWQIQPTARTIQGVLEHTLSTILQEPVHTIGAGRTDAGVHAKSFFAHFDVDSFSSEEKEKTIFRMNNHLPKDIAIYDIYEVHGHAHARFDAVARTYEYTIIQKKSPFLNDYAYFLPYELNVSKMNDASELLCTYEDFESFARVHSDTKTHICNVSKAIWEKEDNIIKFTIKADRFLRNMVRAIVGTIIEIGREKTTMEAFKRIIESKDRRKAGYSVPAKGLSLSSIEYPTDLVTIN